MGGGTRPGGREKNSRRSLHFSGNLPIYYV